MTGKPRSQGAMEARGDYLWRTHEGSFALRAKGKKRESDFSIPGIEIPGNVRAPSGRRLGDRAQSGRGIDATAQRADDFCQGLKALVRGLNRPLFFPSRPEGGRACPKPFEQSAQANPRGLGPHPGPFPKGDGGRSLRVLVPSCLRAFFRHRFLTVVALIATLMLPNHGARAQYEVPWLTIDTGGTDTPDFGMCGNDGYEVRLTVGQLDARNEPDAMSNPPGFSYRVTLGFWQTGLCGRCLLYADIVNDTTPPPYGPGRNCLVELAEITKVVVDAYAAGAAACTDPVLVDAELIYLAACPRCCEVDADCPLNEEDNPSVCTTLNPGQPTETKQCCGVVEAADVLAVLDAYNGVYQCPHPCPP